MIAIVKNENNKVVNIYPDETVITLLPDKITVAGYCVYADINSGNAYLETVESKPADFNQYAYTFVGGLLVRGDAYDIGGE